MTDPGPALTLGQMLDRAAARSPDGTAVVFKGERIGYAELRRHVDDFARGLLGLGPGPGDHVMLWMPNCVEWNVANLAIAKSGAVTVTCNSRYKAFEVDYVLRSGIRPGAQLAAHRVHRCGPGSAEIMRRILDREGGLGMDALVVYGLTEATGGTHWTRPGDPIERRVSTVRIRTAETEDRIVDPATGRELPPSRS